MQPPTTAATFRFCPTCRKNGTIVCRDGTEVVTNSIAAANDAAQKLLEWGNVTPVEMPALLREIQHSGLAPHCIFDFAYRVQHLAGKVIITALEKLDPENPQVPIATIDVEGEHRFH